MSPFWICLHHDESYTNRNYRYNLLVKDVTNDTITVINITTNYYLLGVPLTAASRLLLPHLVYVYLHHLSRLSRVPNNSQGDDAEVYSIIPLIHSWSCTRNLYEKCVHQILSQVHASSCSTLTAEEYGCVLFRARKLYRKIWHRNAWHTFKKLVQVDIYKLIG